MCVPSGKMSVCDHGASGARPSELPMSEANELGVQLRLARERAAERRSNGMRAMRLVKHRAKGASLRQSGHVGQVELATIGARLVKDTVKIR